MSAGYTEGFYRKPRIDKELLAKHAKGLIGLSSCLKGEIPQAITTDQTARALASAGTFRDLLGKDNFFLEMQWHGIEDQKVVNRGLAPLAKDLGLPLVATNDVHYLRHGDHVPHDILLCIGTARNVNDRDRLRYHGDQFYLKTGDEMVKTFGGEFPEAISNTVRIAERCNVDLSGTENHLPNFDVPEGFTLDGYFEHIVREGFAERLERLPHAGLRGIAAPHDRGVRAAALVRDRDDQADAVPGLFPDRLGLHPLRARAGHCGGPGPRVGRRAAWSPTACASPTSIRSSTTSSSSAS